jgi:autotransporter translocation and assembly factor TamB
LLVLFMQHIGRFAIGRALALAGRALHARISCELIEGDPFGSPAVRGLKVVIGPDSLLADRVSLSYNPLGMLRGRFSLSGVDVVNPRLYVSSKRPQRTGGHDSASCPLKRSGPGSFPRLAIGRFRLTQGAVFLDTVRRVDSVNLSLWLVSGRSDVRVGLQEASAWLTRERVAVRQLAADARLTTDSLALTDLVLMTRESRLQGGLRLAFDSSSIAAQLDNVTVSLGEFTHLPGRVQARGSAGARKGRVSAQFDYAAQDLVLRELTLPRIAGRLALTDSVLAFSASGRSEALGGFDIDVQLDLRDTGFSGSMALERVAVRRVEPSLPDYRLDASVEFGGRSTDSVGARVGARISELGIDSLLVSGRYQAGRVDIDRLQLRGPAGRLRADGWYDASEVRVRCVIESLDLVYLGRLTGQPLSGTLAGMAEASGKGDSWNLSGGLRAKDLAYGGASAVRSVADFDLSLGRSLSGRIAVGAESVAYRGYALDAAQFVWTGPEFELRVDLPRNRLRATGDAALARDRIDADVAMFEFATERETLVTTRPFHVGWTRDSLDVRGAATTVAGGTVDLDLAVTGGRPPDVNLHVRNLDLDKLRDLVGFGPEISGTVDLDLSGRDTMSVRLGAQSIRAPRLGLALSRADVALEATRSEARIDYVKLFNARESSAVPESSVVSGRVEYDLGARLPLSSVKLALKADLRDPGVWVLGFLKGTIDVADGQIYGLLSLAGSFAEPEFDGRVRIARARIRVPSINTGVERVNAELVFQRNRIVFEKLSGRSSKGAVVATGFIDLGKSWQVDTLHFGVDFTGATFNPQPEIYAIAGGRIALDLARNRPFALSGTVDVAEALLAIGFGQSVGGAAGPDTTFVYDIRVRGERGIWLRNSLVDIELSVDLSLRKTLTETVYSGELSSIQGNVYYLDHTLQVTQGVLRFQSINTLNPDLDITAELPIRSARDSTATLPERVVLSVTGTLEQPQLRFSSEPPGWDAAEIASYLNFNVTPEQFSALEQKDAVTRLLSQRLLGYFQTQVAKRARGFVNLDYLEVQSGLAGGEAKVTVGKYVGRKLYVSYTQNFTGDIQPVFRIEYYLNRRNELVAERNDLGRVSVRYRLKFRY